MSYIKLRLAIVFIMLIIIGVILVGQYSKDSRAMSKGMPDFNTMLADDFEVGGFVQGTIYELNDEFAYLEEYSTTFGVKTGKEKVTAHYYVMPLYESYDLDQEYPQYIAVCLRNANMVAIAEQILKEGWDYWANGTIPDVWTELPITGKVTALDGELEDYFYEWIMYGEESTNRADFAQFVAPYVITYYEPSGISGGLTGGIIMLVIGIAGAAVVLTLAIKDKNRGSAESFPVGTVSYPTSTDYDQAGGSSGYTPASSDIYSTNTSGMDELDTSSLGVGIDDENNN